jgi:hypothetical protein
MSTLIKGYVVLGGVSVRYKSREQVNVYHDGLWKDPDGASLTSALVFNGLLNALYKRHQRAPELGECHRTP